jgi:hypothetical protein
MEQLQTRLGVLPPLIASSSLHLRASRKGDVDVEL